MPGVVGCVTHRRCPGQTTKTITIEVKGDSKREGNETFYLDLFANSGNSSFTKNRGLGTILNDESWRPVRGHAKNFRNS